MSNKKLLRAEETVKREIGYILDRKVQDPRIGMAPVTRVELADALSEGRISTPPRAREGAVPGWLPTLERLARSTRAIHEWVGYWVYSWLGYFTPSVNETVA